MNSNVRVIQSIQRAIDIINCFSESKPSLSIHEISNEISLHINTTRGIINTLVYNGLLEHDLAENKYSLGLLFISKAELVSLNSVDSIKELIKPWLRKIADHYEVSARLQLVSRNTIHTVETQIPENGRYILQTRLGMKFPLNATSSGKLVLYYSSKEDREAYLKTMEPEKYTEHTKTTRGELEAELEFIHNNGYSLEDEEIGTGISSIAVPLLDKKGSFLGTISITATNAVMAQIRTEAVSDMKKAADEFRKVRG